MFFLHPLTELPIFKLTQLFVFDADSHKRRLAEQRRGSQVKDKIMFWGVAESAVVIFYLTRFFHQSNQSSAPNY